MPPKDIDELLSDDRPKDIGTLLQPEGARNIDSLLVKDPDSGFFSGIWDFINSGPGGRAGIFTDPYGYVTNEGGPNLKDSFKSVAGGTISGLTFGALEPFKNDKVSSSVTMEQLITGDIPTIGDLGGFKGGRFVGEVAPLGLLSKSIGGAKVLSKLPSLLKPFVTGGAIGAVTGTGREAVDFSKGGEFNVGDIALEAGSFALLDGMVGLFGKGISRLVRNGDARGFVDAARTARDDGKIKFTDKELLDASNAIKKGNASPFYGFADKEKDILTKHGLTPGVALERANETGEPVMKIGGKTRGRHIGRSMFSGLREENFFQPVTPKVTKFEEAILKDIDEGLISIKTSRIIDSPAEDYIVRRGSGSSFEGSSMSQPKESLVSTIDKSPRQRAKDALKKANEIIENPIRMHERLGTKEIMYDAAREADHKVVVETKEIISGFHDSIKGKFGWWKKPGHSKNIGIYAIAQQKNGKDVLRQMGITDIPKLSKNEQEAYKFMRDKLEKMYFDLQKSRLDAGLVPFPKVENYFTFWRTIEGELNSGHNVITMDSKNIGRQLKETPFRFKNKRVIDDYGEVNLDAFNVFEKYVTQATRHKYMTPVVAKNHQMLEGKFISGFDLKTQAPQAHNQLTEWNNFISGLREPLGERELSRKVSTGMRALNQNVAFAVLSYNLRSMLIQPTAIINSVSLIGPKSIKEGIKGLFNKEIRSFALEKSQHLSSRVFDTHVTEAMESIGGRFSDIRKRVGNFGMLGLQSLDRETAMATWIGAYNRGSKVLKMAEKDAISYADDIVIKSQASGSRIDVSKLQRTDIGKIISPFQTFVINNWGFLTKDVLGIGDVSITNSKAREQVFRYMVGVMATNILFEDVLQTRSPFPAPFHAFANMMESDDDVLKAIGASALEMSEILPVFGGSLKYGSSPFGAGFQTATDVITTVSGNNSLPRSLETIGKVAGVPASTQLRKFNTLLQEQN